MNKINELYKDSLVKIIDTVKEYGYDKYLLAQKFRELAINDYEIEECFLTGPNLLEFILNKYNELIMWFFNEGLYKILNFYMMEECKKRIMEMTPYVYYKCITKVIYEFMTYDNIKNGLKKYENM